MPSRSKKPAKTAAGRPPPSGKRNNNPGAQDGKRSDGPAAQDGKGRNGFDAQLFLQSIGSGRTQMDIKNKAKVYAQGGVSDSVYYIQKGKVRLSVVSKTGKEATVAILSPGDFFGEGCISGQVLRIESASAVTDCELLKIEKTVMMAALHEHNEFSDLFVAHLLSRNIKFQEDLVDQLFNSSEKRLARILLVLARYGKEGKPDTIVPKLSQEVLAEMVGTTRSRVSYFMNRFRRMGFIEYNGEISVHSSLLNVVLLD